MSAAHHVSIALPPIAIDPQIGAVIRGDIWWIIREGLIAAPVKKPSDRRPPRALPSVAPTSPKQSTQKSECALGSPLCPQHGHRQPDLSGPKSADCVENSKIAGFRKSRKCCALATSAAARLCRCYAPKFKCSYFSLFWSRARRQSLGGTSGSLGCLPGTFGTSTHCF
jgi:hypothetical protein